MSRFILLSFIFSFLTAPLLADTPPRKEATPLRIDAGEIRLDGRLDEGVWQSAAVVDDFTQRQPEEGAAPSERTEVRFAYDDAALYVGARMFSEDPSAIAAPVTRRDVNTQTEHLLISLDTFLDRRTSYTFGVTAAGTRIDRFHPGDSENRVDSSFDPVWEAAVQRDSLGWTAEMRIPFSQLRFLDLPAQRWGLNIRRSIPHRNEHVYWVMVPRQEVGWASRFGDLVGLEVRPVQRIEVMPYASTSGRFRDEVDPENPFDDKRSVSESLGADLKFGLGPNITVDATVNPDFGQVEADPAVINLSAFETFFPERRPFFVEGAQLLRGGGPTYFYSRRIGAAPQRSVLSQFVDYPNTTGILGAAKLIGRFPTGTSVGGLFAVTDEESARTWNPEDETFSLIPVAARSTYGVVRTEQQFGPSQSTAGFTLTSVSRDLDRSDRLQSLLTDQALTGGADWTLRFRGGDYELGGHAGFSRVEGDARAIARLQRSSARYYQRPDATHLDYDPTRTSLDGYSGSLRLEKLSGNWLWTTSVNTNSPGFELNDAGILTGSDSVFAYGNLRYRETQPRGIVRDYDVGISTENAYNTDGTRTFTALRSDTAVTWKNFWTSGFTTWVDLRAESDRLTRGGPLMGTGQAWVVIGSLGSSSSAKHTWRGWVYYGESELGESTIEVRAPVGIRPSPRWQLSAEPVLFRSTDPRLYFRTLPNGPEATFNQRYVFSTIERDELALRMRAQYALTPDLSFELYVEPFAASGRFSRFGELPEPGARHLRVYGEEGTEITRLSDGSYRVTADDQSFGLADRDYNIRSFRSNTVLRWEWRRGSTMYLVWQQDRFGQENPGRATFSSLGETFSASGDNILTLKISYWIPLGRS
jgi:hypothetical protein